MELFILFQLVTKKNKSLTSQVVSTALYIFKGNSKVIHSRNMLKIIDEVFKVPYLIIYNNYFHHVLHIS